jgi:hypothetical protein
MKKLSIVLLCIGGMLFGAEQASTSFNIYLKVDPVHQIKILKGALADINIDAFDTATTLTGHTFTELATSVSDYKMVVKTNNKSPVSIDVVVENIKSTGITSEIAYTIVSGTKEVTSASTEVTDELFSEDISLSNNGMRLIVQPFTITLNSTDIDKATAATYVSDIVFKVIAP